MIRAADPLGTVDVNRKLAGDIITKMLHESIRANDGSEVDVELSERFSRAQAKSVDLLRSR
jgi:hypothetical protein